MYYERRPSAIKRAAMAVWGFITGVLAVVIVLVVNAIGFGLAVALPVQWLWNLCFAEIFTSMPQVGFVSVFGTIVMLKILKGAIS
jgi:hypothetical protein